MAVVIRLARIGKKHDPRYRLTVADSRRYVTSKYLDILGTYVPTPRGQEKEVAVDLEKVDQWMKKGALPSDRAEYVIKKARALVK